MKIGILQTGHALETIQKKQGDYDAMFARLLDGHGFDYVTYDVVDGVFPPGAEAADGWLITGSKHGTYENHPWIPPLEELIRQIYAAGQPMIGICFGHQIIAQALGGKVEKFSGGWAGGRIVYQIDGRDISLNAWHQDQVVELPPEATVIGRNDFCQYAALAYGNRVISFQPHPEFDDFVMDNLIRHRAYGNLSKEMIEQVRASFANPEDSDIIASRMAEFFKKPRLA